MSIIVTPIVLTVLHAFSLFLTESDSMTVLSKQGSGRKFCVLPKIPPLKAPWKHLCDENHLYEIVLVHMIYNIITALNITKC